ncbi:hypothetical protein [Deinococcus hopiensis]|uniref:Uncharacterized protein n=1 Tax=Deinococcus hopiensis KR-140 TaxID=695939 RepID=A0A1W1UIY3_9DEIO|nr:hypothetical protein [Deinococcus hopiensis]SMB81085.1 hypothetical protein SAMN00790413_04457 [Deinococcus hopiensis KR-140]
MDEDTNDGLFPDLLAEMGQGDLGTTIRQGQEGELETTSESAQGKDAGLERGNPEETSQPEPKVQTENEGREGKPVGEGQSPQEAQKDQDGAPTGTSETSAACANEGKKGEANGTGADLEASGEASGAGPKEEACSLEGKLQRYSEVLRAISLGGRKLVVDGYGKAIRDGIIRAVPLKGERFTIRVGGDGEEKGQRRTLPDDMIRMTPEVMQWFSEQALASQYAHMMASGRIGSTAERLRTGKDDFDRLADLHRQVLISKAQK